MMASASDRASIFAARATLLGAVVHTLNYPIWVTIIVLLIALEQWWDHDKLTTRS